MSPLHMVLLLSIASPIACSTLDLEYQLTQESCQLLNNSTLKRNFQLAVRSRYPNASTNIVASNRYFNVFVNTLGKIKCYSTCPRVDQLSVTWCVHIYHPAEEVKICLNGSGVINETSLAAFLNLHSQFSVCDDAGALCSTATPTYMNRAYLVCTVRTNNCSDRSFIELWVEPSHPNPRFTDVTFSPTNVSLGNQAVLQCRATVNSAQGSITWSNGSEPYYRILEDPFCVDSQNITCPKDTSPLARIAKLKRVRAYSIYDSNPICGWKLLNMVGYLLISNATLEDQGLYYCNASTDLIFSAPVMKSASVFLFVANRSQTTATETRNNSLVDAFSVNNTLRATYSYAYISSLPYNASKVLALPHQEALSISYYWIAIPVSIILVAILIFPLAILAIKVTKKRRRIEATNIVIPEQEFCAITQESYSMQKDTSQVPDPWEFPRENLCILHNMLLGKGEFGQVYKGQALGIIAEAPERNIVAVKMVKDNAPLQEMRDLYDEMELMKKIQPHENILNLLRCCSKPGGPLYLIIEYAMHGSLRSFLNSCEEAVHKLNHQPIITRKRSRLGSSSSTSSTHHLLSSRIPTSAHTPSDSQTHFTFPPVGTSDGAMPEEYRVAHAGMAMTPFAHTVAPISTDYINCRGLIQMEDVQNFALQIASGLKHLEAMNIVHCDLAARNILIAEGFVLKICDFGMARDISEKEYYRKSPKGRVPVKWTAPEALEEHLYTFKSDIWSFGIVLWEIFTYGHSPYPDIEIQAWEQFIQFLKDGNRPPLPSGCPENIYDIMQKCWKLNPDERPSANVLVDIFIPKYEAEPFTPTSQDECIHLEQVQEIPERYVDN